MNYTSAKKTGVSIEKKSLFLRTEIFIILGV